MRSDDGAVGDVGGNSDAVGFVGGATGVEEPPRLLPGELYGRLVEALVASRRDLMVRSRSPARSSGSGAVDRGASS